MKLHLVGGFLGSGKTTAIIGAAKQLMAQGLRVGVVTNDQGQYLVDTAFFELANVPTVEVSGGCFCCNYDDLAERLAHLTAAAQPDVIFAESVGSCADIVATVVKPLQELNAQGINPSSFSVFADARLLRLWLLGQSLPFADNVIYIFEKQLEEAGLLVINKIDLLTLVELEETVTLLVRRFDHTKLYLQNALKSGYVTGWLEMLTSDKVNLLPQRSLEIDYTRYGRGEAQLAWLDETITLPVTPGTGQTVARWVIGAIAQAIREQQWPIGHLKFLVRGAAEQAKISLPTLNDNEWRNQIPELSGSQVTLLVNARVQAPAERLQQVIQQAVAQVTGNISYTTTNVDYFHPAQPQPTHRLE